MVVQQDGKPLSDHTGGSKNRYGNFFHFVTFLFDDMRV
jgi:hypothetical protein